MTLLRLILRSPFVVPLLPLVLVTVVFLSACTPKDEPPKFVRVGIVNLVSTLDPLVTGFRKGLKDEGYEEGANIEFLYTGPLRGMKAVRSEFERLSREKVDLLFCLITPVCQVAKEVLADTDIPVVFAVVSIPLKSGLTETLQKPGGRFTGVSSGDSLPQAVEWLKRIVPDLRRLYVPFNPGDKSNVIQMPGLRKATDRLGIELVSPHVTTHEEATRALSQIPDNVQAVMEIPSGFWGKYIGEFVTASLSRKLPLLGANKQWVEKGATISFNFDNEATGLQASRIAAKVLRGTKPAVIPVERADNYLVVNLKTARQIGLTIPTNILKQAHQIIR